MNFLDLRVRHLPAENHHDPEARPWSIWFVRLCYISLGNLLNQVITFDPSVDQIVGPVIISACLFFAILANFVIRGEAFVKLFLVL